MRSACSIVFMLLFLTLLLFLYYTIIITSINTENIIVFLKWSKGGCIYMEDKINKLKLLVEKYKVNLTQYKRGSYNETEVRNDFVNPFFELLGWDVNNQQVLPQHLREVKHEASVMVEEDGEKRKKNPDYSFRIAKETKFFLETKKPNVDVTINKEPAFQLRRYGWNGNLKISVLTNFNDLIIYDCSIRPEENDDVNKALIAKYNFEDYTSKFEDIYRMLSKESVINGTFDKTFDNISSPYKKEPFDDYFLSQIQQWRNSIAEDVVQNNPQIEPFELNVFVQKLLNRILFLRICEDRNIEEYETLKNVRSYDELKKIFVKADKRYDSGLFELIDEEGISVSDHIMMDIFLNLYYPNSSYEFSVVDSYMIGQIYELFLDEEINISKGKKVILQKKPEVVDSQGVVNTPKYIADIIVKQTLDPIFKDKTLEQIKDIKIADICCGSGIFLLSAYEYIINFYIEKIKLDNELKVVKRGDIYKSADGQITKLSLKLKRKILQENLFGVDIDNLAVEVAKFNLLLKSIEDCNKEEIEGFIALNRTKVLPNIDENIKTGNSLVDYGFANYDKTYTADFDLINKIRAFDWKTEFFDGFNGEKFDAIIGNPPYIRVQNLAKYSIEEYQFYKSNVSPYVTAKTELMDKYYLFIERALNLIKDNGYIGYIIPHKFMTIEAGQQLRKVMSDKKCVKNIIHFKSNQVFRGKTTYTCIVLLSTNPSKTFEIGFVDELNQFMYNQSVSMNKYNNDFLSSKPWVFLSNEVTEALEKVKSKCKPLSYFADVFVGLQTSNDAFYIIELEREDQKFGYFKDFKGVQRKVERDILRKCIYDVKIEKYKKIKFNKYIIFPYKVVGNRAKLYSIDEMKNKFPECFDYFCAYKDLLDLRSIKKRDDTNWHQFGRNQSLTKFIGKEHLIWPVLSTEPNYVYDDQSITFTGGGNGPYYGLEIKHITKESIFYIQAVLNHEFIETIVKNKASTFRGNYYSHGKQFIQDLPIRMIDFSNCAEKTIYDEIVNRSLSITNMYRKIERLRVSAAIKPIERAIEIEKQKIKKSIDTLYEIENLF